MTILEKIKFEEDWLSEVNLTKENVKIAFYGIRATALEQQQQPCEDCISRAEVLMHSHIEYDDDGVGHRVIYAEDIEELPPVQPQRPKGKWIEVELPPYGGFCKCPSCGSEWDFCDNNTELFEYCPRCGMDLREDKE